jgi:hypothetical protein
MIGVKLGKYLAEQADVQAELSHDGKFGMFLSHKPQGFPLPNGIITVVGGNPDYSLTGPIADLAKTVQVDIDAARPQDAIRIALLVKDAIEFSSDNPGDQTWDDTTIKSCTVEQERDQEFPPADASDQWVYRRSVDYRVTYVR